MLSEYTPTTTLATADPERSRQFYEGVLGFTAGDEEGGGVFYEAGNSSFFVYESGYAGTNKATAMSFEVPTETFDAEIQALRDAGIGLETFEMEGVEWDGGVALMEGLRSAWFRDPDGNILNVECRAA
jgi:catechol 2,3-dioxygenase-like lactoylglutathione lyase family enzyme